MKLHIITVGEPKLGYAREGFGEYLKRLQRFHSMRITHISDKQNNATHLLQAAGNAYKVVLVINGGKEFSSPELAEFLDKRALEGREVCFLVGGPDGLLEEVIQKSDLKWSFSKLTFPHDLAMLILAETLYRASTISAGHPYHH